MRCNMAAAGARRLAALLVLAVVVSRAAAADPPVAWLEAESPAEASFSFKPEASARPQLLSGGAWLTKSIEGDATGQIPAGGYQLRYNVDMPAAGAYELWARIEFEWCSRWNE